MKKEIMMVALAVGLAAGCATREKHVAELRDLPFDVQRAVIELAPNGDIEKVERKREGDRIVYDISFQQPDIHPELRIAADGTLLENGDPIIMRERAGAAVVVVPEAAPVVRITREELPTAVLNAILANAPNAQVTGIDKEAGAQVIYKVELDEQGTGRTLRIAEDGTVMDRE